MSRLIEVGDTFPEVSAHLVEGGDITLPEAVAGGWAVVLFYRGHWCPYCRKQLIDFQRNLEAYEGADIQVIALSSDPRKEALNTVTAHEIEFPVAYGLDPKEMHDRLGVYLGSEGGFIQATGFVLRPAGVVELAVYSSGAVGRLVAADVLGLIQYARSRAPTP